MLDKALGWIRGLTELGVALIALGVVLQIILERLFLLCLSMSLARCH